MTDNNRNRTTGGSDSHGGGVLLVVLAVIAVVVFVGYWIGNTPNSIRYPDLVVLLQKTAYESYGSETLSKDDQGVLELRPTSELPFLPAKGSVVVPASSKRDTLVEYSKPQDIKVSADLISGTVMARTFDTAGKPLNAAKRVKFTTQPPFRSEIEERELGRLLVQSGVVWDNERPSTFFQDHGFTLLMVLLLVGFGFMVLRRANGAGSPLAFSRSRGRLYAQNDTPTTFDDIAGIDEAIEEIREVVDFLKNAEKYQQLGGRIPKGVLLVGPPGTGKTLLAKAIAGEAGTPFFSLSGSDFVEMYVGVGAARVRDMFRQAANQAPCIIFIDELDALGKSRSGATIGGHDEREQTLNALLVEMDGFDSETNVIVVAATNRPETLDAALLRPGRFDRQVLVDRPDIGGRKAILEVHVKNVKLSDTVDLAQVASITPGFVGADLANLVNEAALLAARGGKSAVSLEEFNEAVERVTAGLEKKNHVMSEDEKVRIAYHEAGHALVADALPNTDPVHKVSIIPRGLGALGYVMQRPGEDRYLRTKSELESTIRVLMAGTLSEELIFEDISTGAQNDLERATEIARAMVMDYGMSDLGRINYRQKTSSPFLPDADGRHVGLYSEQTSREIDAEVRRIIKDALCQTSDILNTRREALEAITQRLLEVEAIDGEELSEIISAHSAGPVVVPGTAPKKPRATVRNSNQKQDVAFPKETQT